MKKIITMSMVLLCMLYLMPALLHAPGSAAAADGEGTENVSASVSAQVAGKTEAEPEPQSKDRSETVTLLADGQIKTLDLQEYLAGVLFAEMPASFPVEALKAQAVAARTYTMYKKQLAEISPDEAHAGAELCADSTHCKAYRPLAEQAEEKWGDKAEYYTGIIRRAVEETDGEVILYEGAPIAAVFHATSSAKTENASDVWGGEAPYLVSVDSPGSEDDPRYLGTVTVTAEEFRNVFGASYPEADLTGAPGTWFKASNRSEAGGVIDVSVGGVRVSGGTVRRLFGLSSTNFTLTWDESSLTFHTVGRGHGVGMSQYGARRMALDGADYRQILENYYTGVTFAQIGE